MKRSIVVIAFLAMLPVFAACGGGGSSEPPVTQVNPAASTLLQFSVGIATIAFNGGHSVAFGLNTVETLRQADGLSGTLYNVPRIVGPSNFVVGTSTLTGNPVLAAGSDAGSNHITWATLNQSLWTGPPRELKASSTGVFGYGFCPCNSDGGPSNGTPALYQAFNLPVYGNDEKVYYGGPPAFPAEDPTVTGLGFLGYSLGFTDFAVQPKIGSYRLDVAVPPNFIQPGNPTPTPNPGNPTPQPGAPITATAQLVSLNSLPLFANPTFVADGKGGGTVGIVVPHGAIEAIVVVRAVGGSGTGSCVNEHLNDQFYTLVTRHTGATTLALADSLGADASRTLCPQSSYEVYAAGFDYPAYEDSYPQNLSIAPSIASPNGQADVTTSDVLSGTYPS
jgi:hypothetical protein